MDPLAAAAHVPAPTENELNQRAGLLRDKPNCCDGWVCLDCGHRNEPIDNLLCRIPPFKCAGPGQCNAKCPGTAGWSISDCIINGVRTDFLIRDQGKHPTCTVHALLAGMDAAIRIEGALRGVIVSLPLNIVDLFEKYYELFPKGVGHEVQEVHRRSTTPNLLKIAQLQGVEYICPRGCHASKRMLKLQSWFQLSTNTTEVDTLIRLIASGFPLIVGMRTGRCFKMAGNGELYMGPPLPKNHAVLLIGIEIRQMFLPDETTGENMLIHRVLFRARNSQGDKAHTSAELIGYGGEVYLLQEDLGTHVFGFHLELPDWMTVPAE